MSDHVCPVCGGTEFVLVSHCQGQSGLWLSACKECSAVFTDLDKATARAADLQKSRELELEIKLDNLRDELRREFEAIMSNHEYRNHGMDNY